MNKINIISFVVSGMLIIIAVIISNKDISTGVSDFDIENNEISNEETKIILGEIESAHEHMTMLIVVDGKIVNLTDDKYMLKDYYSHLEDDNGFVIHKHAKGVTLSYFLTTLGIDLTQDCITVDTGRQYCSSPTTGKILRVIVNGNTIKDPDVYEIKHEDKILIDYSDDDEIALQFKFNTIPDVPLGLL